jgi:hypothetical protein
MNADQAVAMMRLLGWEPAFINGSPGMYHREQSIGLVVGSAGLTSDATIVYCDRLYRTDKVIVLPEPRALLPRHLVLMLKVVQSGTLPNTYHVEEKLDGD